MEQRGPLYAKRAVARAYRQARQLQQQKLDRLIEEGVTQGKEINRQFMLEQMYGKKLNRLLRESAYTTRRGSHYYRRTQ